jgi:competence protein ComEC
MEQTSPRLPWRIALLFFLTALLIVAWREHRVCPDGRVHAFILDVGQGDSIFIRGPSGQQVLIDGGPDNAALRAIAKRMSFFDRSLDLLVLTHPNTDHFASFPAILRRYEIGAVLLSGVAYDELPLYGEFLSLLDEKNTPVIPANPARDISLGGGLVFDVLWPLPAALVDPDEGGNDTSVVIKAIFGRDSMLLTGDIERAQEELILASGADIDAVVLKLAHHGSKTSTSTGFLLAVSPDLAVASAGKGNPFGHPHPEILRRLAHFGIPVKVTAEEGTVEVVMDGKE